MKKLTTIIIIIILSCANYPLVVSNNSIKYDLINYNELNQSGFINFENNNLFSIDLNTSNHKIFTKAEFNLYINEKDNNSFKGFNIPKISIDDEVIWSYKGKGVGRYGRQNLFSNNLSEYFINNSQSNSYETTTNLVLPNTSEIGNGSIQLNISGLHTELIQSSSPLNKYGNFVSNLGDVNGDNYIDIGVIEFDQNDNATLKIFFGDKSSFYYSNITLEPPWGSPYFGGGGSVVGGDFNGDGYSDIAVGDIFADSVLLYKGGKIINKNPWIILNTSQFAGFGWDLIFLNDINNDGADELVVGEPLDSKYGTSAGRMFLFYGDSNPDTFPDIIFNGDYEFQYLGGEIINIGDFDKDNYDDFISIVYTDDPVGSQVESLNIFLSSNFRHGSLEPIFIDCLEGEREPTKKNIITVAELGDLDGDGGIEFGVSIYNESKSYVIVFFSNKGLTLSTTKRIFPPNDNIDGFGMFSKIGDYDLDGIDEVIISSISPNETLYFFEYSNGDFIFENYQLNSTFEINGYGYALTPFKIRKNDECYNLIVEGNSTNGIFQSEIVYFGSLNPKLKIDDTTILWDEKGIFRGNVQIEISDNILNEIKIRANEQVKFSIIDNNTFFNVSFTFTSSDITIGYLKHLDIPYDDLKQISNLDKKLNEVIIRQDIPCDQENEILIKLLFSIVDGRGKIGYDLQIETNNLSSSYISIPDKEMFEDSIESLYNLNDFFPDKVNSYYLKRFDNNNFINSELVDNSYLVIDSETNEKSDNWTGRIELQVIGETTDHKYCSKHFFINIQNQNDSPLLLNRPVTKIKYGGVFSFSPIVVDGDNDNVSINLLNGPSDMTYDIENEIITWNTRFATNNTISYIIELDDGISKVQYLLNLTLYDYWPDIQILLEIIKPENASTFTNNFNIDGKLTSNDFINITHLQYRIDDGEWNAITIEEEWDIYIQIEDLSEGEHQVSIRAGINESISNENNLTFYIKKKDDAHINPYFSLALVLIIIICITILIIKLKPSPKYYKKKRKTKRRKYKQIKEEE